ncbi:hypothetical protein M514_12377 [Trichuris suis]|uniref:CCHC-type domain-containing protein n=1 Tax=Trichuris suis TaxID=68888 RepID=A0A085LP54_9BILA|nr:hypothetical protein M513_12377 [Trichuris suis]KFD60656.1 hypothetical protein M514_12377 [Trichuris suis]
MQDHINSMLEVVELLKGAGTEISTDELVAVPLCSLPESYTGLITALEGVMRRNSLLSMLLERCSTNISVASRAVRAPMTYLAMRASAGETRGKWGEGQGATKLECFYCRKIGHVKSECKKRPG